MTPRDLLKLALTWLKGQGPVWAALAALAAVVFGLGGCAPLQTQSTQTGGSNDRTYQLMLDKAVLDQITGSGKTPPVIVQPPVISGS